MWDHCSISRVDPGMLQAEGGLFFNVIIYMEATRKINKAKWGKNKPYLNVETDLEMPCEFLYDTFSLGEKRGEFYKVLWTFLLAFWK